MVSDGYGTPKDCSDYPEQSAKYRCKNGHTFDKRKEIVGSEISHYCCPIFDCDAHDNEIKLASKPEPRKTATIVTTSSGGTFKSADCPYCDKSAILGRELLIMWTCCTGCNKPYNLRYPDGKQSDDCERCHGSRGGVKGNENIVSGEVLCDDCHCDDLLSDDEQPEIRHEVIPEHMPHDPPPATPRILDRKRGDSRRGPRNWPIHYDGRH